jgi:PKD repeat protein
LSVPAHASTNITVRFAPNAAGNVRGALLVSSDGGNSANPLTGVGVVAPSAAFSASPTNGLAPLTVNFTDTSTGTITNRFWQFGDGTTTNTAATSVTHTYGPGTNTVRLTVSGPVGTSTLTRTNFIAAASHEVRITLVRISGTNVLVQVTTVVGRNYQLERRDAIGAGSWTAVDGTVPGTGGNVQLTDAGGAAQARRFYRVHELP